jgi:plastocyanin
VRPRNLLLVLLLGTVTAVLPAMASSETTPSVEAVTAGTNGIYPAYAWSPKQSTVGVGGSVAFSTGSTSAPHGVIWTSSVKPTCSSSVPVEGASKEQWSGSCTFTQAGVYTFHCAVHEEMTGSITVNAAGVTPTMGTPAPAPTPTTPATSPPPSPKPIAVHHLTKAEKLAKALKVCKKKAKGKRAACRKRARKKYGHR